MFVFFFKQKTAYEVRISDWSSDVCSSDLWLSAHGDRVGTKVTFKKHITSGGTHPFDFNSRRMHQEFSKFKLAPHGWCFSNRKLQFKGGRLCKILLLATPA